MRARSSFLVIGVLCSASAVSVARADAPEAEERLPDPVDPFSVEPEPTEGALAFPTDGVQDIGQGARERRARARERRLRRARRRARRRRRARARRRARQRRLERRRARARDRRREEARRAETEPEPSQFRRLEAPEEAEPREARVADPPTEAASTEPERRPPPTVDLHVGGRGEARLARFETRGGTAHLNEVAYPSVGGMIRVRPLNGEAGPERGLELRGWFYYAIGLRSRNSVTDETVQTNFWRAYGDLAMSFEVDPAVELGFGAGLGFDAFSLGEQSVLVVPSAEYLYLRPHLRARFELAGELAVLEIEGAYRGVLDRGALSEHFGTGGETHGFDATARFGGSFEFGLSYGFEAGFAGFIHSFEGDAATAEGESGRDYSVYGGAQLGYAFR